MTMEIKETRESKSEKKGCKDRGSVVEEGASSQGMQAAWRNRFSSAASGRKAAMPRHLDFSPLRLLSNF